MRSALTCPGPVSLVGNDVIVRIENHGLPLPSISYSGSSSKQKTSSGFCCRSNQKLKLLKKQLSVDTFSVLLLRSWLGQTGVQTDSLSVQQDSHH